MKEITDQGEKDLIRKWCERMLLKPNLSEEARVFVEGYLSKMK